jgi:phage terminase large subunit-like protein
MTFNFDWWVDHPRHCAEFSGDLIKSWRRRFKDLANHPDYYFDESEGIKIVTFIEKNIVHLQAPHDGKPFILEDWQKYDVLYPIFGLKRKNDDKRVIREVYFSLSKKSGKTPLIAAMLLYLLYKSKGEGHEICCAASTLNQAMLCYEKCAVGFIKKNPILKHPGVTKILRAPFHKITSLQNNSVMFPVSCNEDGLDGQNISHCIVDELHRIKSQSFIELVRNSLSSRQEPLLFFSTTAGSSITSYCYATYERAKSLLASPDLHEVFFAPIIYEADEHDKWSSMEAVKKACPNLGVSVTHEFIRNEIEKSTNSPNQRFNFIRFYNNRWNTGGAEKFVDMTEFMKNAYPKSKIDQIMGKKVECKYTVSVDLSLKQDFTAVCVMAKLSEEQYFYKNTYFTWGTDRELEAREAQEKLPLTRWKREESLINSGKSVIDWDIVEAHINDVIECYKPVKIVYDPAMATPLHSKYADSKLGIAHRGGYANWHFPMVEFGRLIAEGKMHHDGSHLELFNISCLLYKANTEGLIRPCKAFLDSLDKIDGAVAAMMALRGHIECSGEEAKAPKKVTPEVWTRIARTFKQ